MQIKQENEFQSLAERLLVNASLESGWQVKELTPYQIIGMEDGNYCEKDFKEKARSLFLLTHPDKNRQNKELSSFLFTIVRDAIETIGKQKSWEIDFLQIPTKVNTLKDLIKKAQTDEEWSNIFSFITGAIKTLKYLHLSPEDMCNAINRKNDALLIYAVLALNLRYVDAFDHIIVALAILEYFAATDQRENVQNICKNAIDTKYVPFKGSKAYYQLLRSYLPNEDDRSKPTSSYFMANPMKTPKIPVIEDPKQMKAQIQYCLARYIDRVENNRVKHHSFEHGFSFFPKSRGQNRNANLLLAKELLKQINEGKALSNIFSSRGNIKNLRTTLINNELGKISDHGINSAELKAVLALGFKASIL